MSTVCTERSMSGGSDVSVRDRVRFYGCRLGNNGYGRCASGKCDNGGASHPGFRRLIQSVGQNLVTGIIICGLSHVDHSVLSFTGVVRLFRRCGIRFISSARGFSASAPVKQTVLGVYVIFTRLRQRAVRGQMASTCCSHDRQNFGVNKGTPCNFRARPVGVSNVGAGGLIMGPRRTTGVQLVFRVCTRPAASCKSVAQCFTRRKVLFRNGRLVHPALTRVLHGPICIRTSLSICRFFGDRNAIVIGSITSFANVGNYCLCRKQSMGTDGGGSLGSRVLMLTPRRNVIPSSA